MLRLSGSARRSIGGVTRDQVAPPAEVLGLSDGGLRDTVRGSDPAQVLDLVELGIGEVRVSGG
jgi:hypothetical protein